MKGIPDLFEPDKYHLPKPAKHRPAAQRTQNRRAKWEDASNPALYENTLFEAADDKWAKPSSGPTKIIPGSAKVPVLAARHSARVALWHKDDAEARPVDITSWEGYTVAMDAAMKANASGIELVGDLGLRAKPWRAHPWDADEQRHVHLGYYPTWQHASYAIRLWNAACGTLDSDGIDCNKWAPQGDWSDEDVARLTEEDIKRIAKSRRY